MEHCEFNIDAGKLECRACGGDYDVKFPQPLWAVSALSKAFSKVHAGCWPTPEAKAIAKAKPRNQRGEE